ncbi:MAG: hypothetical protein ACRYG8_36710 [Janthinobacterium lividum]
MQGSLPSTPGLNHIKTRQMASQKQYFRDVSNVTKTVQKLRNATNLENDCLFIRSGLPELSPIRGYPSL